MTVIFVPSKPMCACEAGFSMTVLAAGALSIQCMKCGWADASTICKVRPRTVGPMTMAIMHGLSVAEYRAPRTEQPA